MSPSNSAPLDEQILAQLCEEVGDERACADFIELFLELLPGRLHDLSTSMNAGAHPWQPAANLAATCRMLGATVLAEHLDQIQEGAGCVASPHWRRAHLEHTLTHARALAAQLRRHVVNLHSNGWNNHQAG